MAHDVHTGHLLFEVEHSVVRSSSAMAPPSIYQVCAEAAVASIWEVMEAIECDAFSVLVNRRLVSKATKGKNWTPVFPHQERAASPDEELDAGNPQDVQICARARKTAASRYPRESAFEVTVYDTERANHRVLFSKYKTHSFPRQKEDLLAPLLPLLIIFAGYSNDEPLLQRLSHFALDHDFALDLVPKDLAPHAGATALLTDLHEALLELQRSLESGDPQMMHSALENMPSELRTKECIVLESKYAELEEVEQRIERAIERIESGFVTSGLDILQKELKVAEQMGCNGEVVERGKGLLISYTEEDECDVQELPQPSQVVHRRSSTRGRLSIRASTVGSNRRGSQQTAESLLIEARAKILSETYAKLFEATKSWPFKLQVSEPRSDGATSMKDIEDFLSKVQECLVKRQEQQKNKSEANTTEILKLQEALEEMQDALFLKEEEIKQLQEKGPQGAGETHGSGSLSLSLNSEALAEPPQRVMPGQIGATEGNSAESEPLVCLDCANALCRMQPDISPEELAELRLQAKLLTERCRDLKAQLKAAKSKR